MKQHLRTALAIFILLATVGSFINYIRRHPEMVAQLANISPLVILVLMLLFFTAFFVYLFITRVSLAIYHKTMPLQEQFLFNAYSSLINFFGPGQSGPVFRAAYLKKRHGLSVRQFGFATLLYLTFFAVISAMLIIVGSRPWWQTLLLMIGVGGVCLAVLYRHKKKAKIDMQGGLNARNLGVLFGLTATQILLLVCAYWIELASMGADVSLSQVLSYTGISNFSLFVALTPGAIGIREAFLIFSQNLHHIDSSSIVAANAVDRGVYIVFLGILFLFVLGMHAKDKLQVNQLKIDQK